MRLGALLFAIIVTGSIVSVLHAWRARRHATSTEQHLQRIDAFLSAWARYGDWNPALKARLEAIADDREEP